MFEFIFIYKTTPYKFHCGTLCSKTCSIMRGTSLPWRTWDPTVAPRNSASRSRSSAPTLTKPISGRRRLCTLSVDGRVLECASASRPLRQSAVRVNDPPPIRACAYVQRPRPAAPSPRSARDRPATAASPARLLPAAGPRACW